ncbi:MAG: adenosylmethionine--8-amino-7-oxononanoate transaminase [Chlamydiae bacterium]|nr:adenosylmethionine--8-amino-7-oxononanoate transaminase [Chlamydiota bacterium]
MDLIKADAECVWHPFTQIKTAAAPIPIVRAFGSQLFHADGRTFIDAISSWWCNIHGHGHPHIVEAISKQAALLDHVLFGGVTHPEAVRLAKRLLKLLPYERVFYSDNGSTAIEVALKMALQYRLQSCMPQGKIMALKGAYHGDTFGAMAAGRSPFHEPFWPLLFDVTFIDPPYAGQEVDLTGVGIFIFEPLIQGAGGFHIYDLEALDHLLKRCKENNILTIADEVMTGFGRTGSLFVTDLLVNKPDFICLSKGLTGGTLPLAVTLTKERIFEGFISDLKSHAFLHGHTYTANAIACAAANASLDLLLDPHCQKQRILINRHFTKLADEMRPFVKRTAVLGTIFIMESYKEDAFFLENGIFVRLLGDILYFMPPYCLKEEELTYMCHIVRESLDYVHLV